MTKKPQQISRNSLWIATINSWLEIIFSNVQKHIRTNGWNRNHCFWNDENNRQRKKCLWQKTIVMWNFFFYEWANKIPRLCIIYVTMHINTVKTFFYLFICIRFNRKATLLKMYYSNDQRHCLTKISAICGQFFRCAHPRCFLFSSSKVCG